MKLVLEDGTEFKGEGFGAKVAVAGEVVFNTGMTGYIETLTDPSYCGQILVFTYPLIGNYGVPDPRKHSSLAEPYESDFLQIQGLIVQSYREQYSHYTAQRSLGQWLQNEGIPAITGIDTRSLTRHLREYGTMRGWILPGIDSLHEEKQTAKEIDMQNEVFRKVAPRGLVHYPGGNITIMLIDVGAKDNIVRSLLKRGVNVIKVPWHENITNFVDESDGILIGNGPGDPQDLNELIQQLKNIIQNYKKPIFGICLGNQLLALATGAATYKLPYGHRSVNQPVQDLLTRRCYITSQNHGYAVMDESLTADWEPWFININDGTNEGIRSRSHPYFGVQFHPEAHPGPQDTSYLFDDFIRIVADIKRG